jgi:low molecular weight protein-tyrosine phosphatase
MKTVLFLCTGNYYRSRFAEHFFDCVAEKGGLHWRAASRGLAVGHDGNIGPISQFAVAGLEARGIHLNGSFRFPLQATAVDLEKASLIVVLQEAEHRPMLVETFPEWADRVEYWEIDDLEGAGPDEALPLLENEVRALVFRLSELDEQPPTTP